MKSVLKSGPSPAAAAVAIVASGVVGPVCCVFLCLDFPRSQLQLKSETGFLSLTKYLAANWCKDKIAPRG